MSLGEALQTDASFCLDGLRPSPWPSSLPDSTFELLYELNCAQSPSIQQGTVF
jgi:hypothetical protein